ncbi:protein shisa-like-1a [Heptranchias perlo]|uniref:protein shisa-like-1a n=1 Tax=Heptranchias perlo TaxID=212740 RepID=UPI00355A106A
MSLFNWLQTVLLLCELLATVYASNYRTCEPYLDAAELYHSGFHCPRLNEERKWTYCCRLDNQTLKYCCNESEFQSTMKINQTAPTRSSVNYGSRTVVFVYGLCVASLLLMDLLHYCTLNRHNLSRYWAPCCLCGCCIGGHEKQALHKPETLTHTIQLHRMDCNSVTTNCSPRLNAEE